MTQSRTYNDNETFCRPGHVVEKDLSTCAASIVDGGEVWLKLEFDETYFISKITIYSTFYTNWFDPPDYWHQSEENFRKYVDLHNNVDVSVYKEDVQQKYCGTLQLTYGLEQSDQIHTLICNAEGDTVKLSKSTGTILVNEVVVLSTTGS